MNIVMDPLHPLKPASLSLAKNILTHLVYHYPGVAAGWAVDINEDGGTVSVVNQLTDARYGFVLPIVKIDAEYKSIVKNAGELLERFNIRRSKVEMDKNVLLKDTKFNRIGKMLHEK